MCGWADEPAGTHARPKPSLTPPARPTHPPHSSTQRRAPQRTAALWRCGRRAALAARGGRASPKLCGRRTTRSSPASTARPTGCISSAAPRTAHCTCECGSGGGGGGCGATASPPLAAAVQPTHPPTHPPAHHPHTPAWPTPPPHTGSTCAKSRPSQRWHCGRAGASPVRLRRSPLANARSLAPPIVAPLTHSPPTLTHDPHPHPAAAGVSHINDTTLVSCASDGRLAVFDLRAGGGAGPLTTCVPDGRCARVAVCGCGGWGRGGQALVLCRARWLLPTPTPPTCQAHHSHGYQRVWRLCGCGHHWGTALRGSPRPRCWVIGSCVRACVWLCGGGGGGQGGRMGVPGEHGCACEGRRGGVADHPPTHSHPTHPPPLPARSLPSDAHHLWRAAQRGGGAHVEHSHGRGGGGRGGGARWHGVCLPPARPRALRRWRRVRVNGVLGTLPVKRPARRRAASRRHPPIARVSLVFASAVHRYAYFWSLCIASARTRATHDTPTLPSYSQPGACACPLQQHPAM